MHAKMCLKCGRVIVGDECQSRECAAGSIAVNTARSLFVCAGGAGLLGMVISASFLYPTLDYRSIPRLFVLLFLVTFLVSIALDGQRAKFIRSMYLVATTFFILSAAVFFLNGALDKHVPKEIQATVAGKAVARGLTEGNVLALAVTWNQKQMVETLRVNNQIFSKAERGDSVGLIVHPGAFSMPWYGAGHLVNGQDAILLNSR
ncbi:MAG: hypothetical protein WCA19_17460 [Candidatus Acidiferrales bacterium]